MTAKVRPATVVMLFRGSGGEEEVFLVHRAPERSFFPDYHAFPGGGLEAQDGPAEDAESWRRCAHRELFEELGVLLTRDPLPPREAVEAARRRLVDDQENYGDIVDDLGVAPDLDALTPSARLLTPPFVPVRYDTQFYTARLPEGQEAEVWPGELAGGRWARPGEALAAWDRFEMKVAAPVILALRLLEARGVEAGLAQWAALDTRDAKGDREPYIEVHPGVRFLPLRTPTIPPAETTNTYVVGRERIVVIDPGTPHAGERRHLASLLESMEAEGGEVAEVLLTHHHSDHVDAAAWLRDRFDAPVAAHAETARALEGKLAVDRTLADGDDIHLGTWAPTGQEWRLEALHTPGHTPGHLCFRDTRRGALVAGDAVAGVGTVVIAPPEGDMAAYFRTLERLRDLEPPLVLPGHGPFRFHGRDLFQGYLDHRQMREDKVVAALAAEPRGMAALVAAVYDDTPRELWGFAEQSLAAHLGKLEAEGRAVREGDGWRAP